MQEIHCSDVSARNSTVNLEVYSINNTTLIEGRYKELSDFLAYKEDYEHFNLKSFLPDDVFKRYAYIKVLQLDVAVMIYRYHQDNYLRTLNYIWKVPVYFDDRNETKLAQTMASLQKLLPKFYTRQMRKNALYKVFFYKFLYYNI